MTPAVGDWVIVSAGDVGHGLKLTEDVVGVVSFAWPEDDWYHVTLAPREPSLLRRLAVPGDRIRAYPYPRPSR